MFLHTPHVESTAAMDAFARLYNGGAAGVDQQRSLLSLKFDSVERDALTVLAFPYKPSPRNKFVNHRTSLGRTNPVDGSRRTGRPSDPTQVSPILSTVVHLIERRLETSESPQHVRERRRAVLGRAAVLGLGKVGCDAGHFCKRQRNRAVVQRQARNCR